MFSQPVADFVSDSVDFLADRRAEFDSPFYEARRPDCQIETAFHFPAAVHLASNEFGDCTGLNDGFDKRASRKSKPPKDVAGCDISSRITLSFKGIVTAMKTPWYLDVGVRHLQPEIMDQPGLEVKTLRTALRAIAGINALASTHCTYWKAIRPLAEGRTSNPVRVLDVACGSGDVAVKLVKLAQRAGLPIIVDGCDRSPIAVSLAQEQADLAQVPSRFFPLDIVNGTLPTDYDVITSSLFLHHLSDDNAVHALRQMTNSARQLVLVNDLIRSRMGYFLARFGAPLLTKSPMVRCDALTSVAGAFTPVELIELAHRAGMIGATISHFWLARMLLAWRKN